MTLTAGSSHAAGNGSSDVSDEESEKKDREDFDAAEADWRANKWEAAVDKFKKVTEKAASTYKSKAHIYMGRYYKLHGRWNEAISNYEDAIKHAKNTRDQEDAETSIGAVYVAKKDYSYALSWFRYVLAKTTDWQQVKYCANLIRNLSPKVNLVAEADCNSCGITAIKEIFRQKGIAYANAEVETLLGNSKASMEDLRRVANNKGLKAYGARVTAEQLSGIEMPVIALVEDPDHYVIFSDATAEGIHIIDPEYSGQDYFMPYQDLASRWKGHVLAFSETPSEVALLSTDELSALKGGVCACCPPTGLGLQNPYTPLDTDGGSLGGCTSPGMPSYYVNMDTTLPFRTPTSHIPADMGLASNLPGHITPMTIKTAPSGQAGPTTIM